MKRRRVIGIGLTALAVVLVVVTAFGLRQVRCGACGSACARRSAVKMPEAAGGLIVETLFGQSSAPANAYVCEQCIEGVEDRVIAEAKKRQGESAQPQPRPYR
jgi:hypothetical protein